MSHTDWILAGNTQETATAFREESEKSIANGYFTLIVLAINQLDLARARSLLETARPYFAIYEKEEVFGNKHAVQAMEAVLGEAEALMAEDILSPEKPFPGLTSREAAQSLTSITGGFPGQGVNVSDIDDGTWSLCQAFTKDEAEWTLRVIFCGRYLHRFEADLQRFRVHIFKNRKTVLKRHFITYDHFLKVLREVVGGDQ